MPRSFASRALKSLPVERPHPDLPIGPGLQDLGPWVDEDELERVKYWFLGLSDHLFSPHLALHRALVEAGYTRIRIERLATHPVWEVRANLPLNAPVADRRRLKRHIRALLKAAHLPAARDEIVVMLAGRRLHVSFVQAAGRGVVMSRGVATMVEEEDPETAVEYDE